MSPRGQVRLCKDIPGSIEIQVGVYYEIFQWEQAFAFANAILSLIPKAIEAERMPHGS